MLTVYKMVYRVQFVVPLRWIILERYFRLAFVQPEAQDLKRWKPPFPMDLTLFLILNYSR